MQVEYLILFLQLKDFLTQEMEPEDKVIVFVGRKAT